MSQGIIRHYWLHLTELVPGYAPWQCVAGIHLEFVHHLQLYVSIENIFIPTHHIRTITLNQAYSKLKSLWMYEIVRIHKHYVLGISDSHSIITGMRKPTISLMHHHEAWVFCCIFFKNSRTSIRGTIINADCTPLAKCLFNNTIKTTSQIGLDIVNRNNNIYSTCVHNCLKVIYLYVSILRR